MTMSRCKKALASHAVFTPRQNKALRTALRRLKQTKKLSQLGLGRLLGIAQQNAGRLLTLETAGFSYDTATRLVRESGFDGVDAFFAVKGVAQPGRADDEGLAATGTD